VLTPPLIWPSFQTPAAEIPAIKSLLANLHGVVDNVEAWEHALRLYQYAVSKPHSVQAKDASAWKFVAAHECVHQLHHFRNRLRLIKGTKVRECPSIASTIDHAGLRGATKLLGQYFPDIEHLRNAIAHAAEHDVLPEGHATELGYVLVGFRGSDRFSASYEGFERQLDITDESLMRIREVAITFLSAFVVAARTLQLQGHLE
jgi:hypothetical protein